MASLDCKDVKPVTPKRDQPWIFIGKTDAEAEAPILWLPDAKSQLIGKDPDSGKDWGQEEKGQQWIRWLDDITDSLYMNLSKLWETEQDRRAWHAAVHGIAKSQTWLNDWTTTTTKTEKSLVLKLKQWLKNFKLTKVQDQMASQMNTIKQLEKS